MLDMDFAAIEQASAGLRAQPFEDLPLSYGQRALWFLQRLDPNYIGHNVVHAVWVRAFLDFSAVCRAFQRLVDRHPALRTSIFTLDGEPVQRVYAHQEVCFRSEDASAWSEEQLNERLEEEMLRPISLENEPLFQVTFFSRAPDDHVMLCTKPISYTVPRSPGSLSSSSSCNTITPTSSPGRRRCSPYPRENSN
jgi:hypothetical protein